MMRFFDPADKHLLNEGLYWHHQCCRTGLFLPAPTPFFFFLPPPVLTLASAPIKNSVHCEIFRSQGRRGGAFLRALKSLKTKNTIQNRYRYRFVIKELWWYHLPQDLRIYGGSLGISEVIPKSCTSISCFLKIYSKCNCVPKIFYLPNYFYLILFYLIFWDYPFNIIIIVGKQCGGYPLPGPQVQCPTTQVLCSLHDLQKRGGGRIHNSMYTSLLSNYYLFL